MLRLAIFLLMTLAVYAQNPADLFNKPPAEVDQALRARITEFYQLHVDKQFRRAEALVAEDTKEFFYTRNKPSFLSFEISRIDYSENFTRAKAIIVAEQIVMMLGFTDKPMKLPQPSTWKLEDGKWCWYVDAEAVRASPFGKMAPGPGRATGGAPPALPTIDSVLNLVRPDKQGVSLKPGERDEVKFRNTAPGQMNLAVMSAPEGIEAKFDQAQLKGNETGTLTIEAGKDAKPGAVSVRVAQTLEFITIKVEVK